MPEVAAAHFDILAENLQHPRLGEIVADGDQMVAGPVDVEIVSAVIGLFAVPVDEDAHMGLIGTFVLGEPDIPVNPVRAVRGGQGTDRIVKRPDPFDEFHGQFIDLVLGLQVIRLVGVEPGLVIMQG